MGSWINEGDVGVNWIVLGDGGVAEVEMPVSTLCWQEMEITAEKHSKKTPTNSLLRHANCPIGGIITS